VFCLEWNRRLVHIVCNNNGVWAVDDQGCIHFRHGHMAASQNFDSDEVSFLPPAWIRIPGEAERRRCFSQIYCGPADWMVIKRLFSCCFRICIEPYSASSNLEHSLDCLIIR